MIYTAATEEQLVYNQAAIYWRGVWIKQEDARREFDKHLDAGGTLTFWQFVCDMNYRILD